MQRNKLVWCFVFFVVLVTIAVVTGKIGDGQEQIPVTKQSEETLDLSKYAITDYETSESLSVEKKKNGERYNNMGLVVDQPNPETSGARLFDHSPIPSAIPTKESDLIVIGNISGSAAALSGDKKGVYSEYNVETIEVLKGKGTNGPEPGGKLLVDRAGGYVRYPNGQKVLYLISGRDLPTVGKQYLLFLIKKDSGQYYEILTGFELESQEVKPLDSRVDFSGFQKKSRQNFLDIVRGEIAGHK